MILLKGLCLCASILVLGLIISVLNLTGDAHAQSQETQVLIDQFQSFDEKHKHRARSGLATKEYREIGKLARTIGKNKGISPQIRVNVLTTVLAREIRDPYSLNPRPDGYGTFSSYLKRQYIFALADVGPEASPHLKRHLKHLKPPMEKGSGSSSSLGKSQGLKKRSKKKNDHLRDASQLLVEKQLALCILGLLRDQAVYAEVMEIFLESGDGELRTLAAMALEKLKNRAAIPALKRALKDDFHLPINSDWIVPNHPVNIIYPVREEASSALRAMGVEVDRKGNDFWVVE